MRLPRQAEGHADLPLQRDARDQQLREGEEPEEQARHQAGCRAQEAAAPDGCGQPHVLQPPALPQHPLRQGAEGDGDGLNSKPTDG